MLARNLACPQPSVRAGAPATEAAGMLVRPEVASVLVVDDEGRLVGAISDEDVLHRLLPAYVETSGALARALEEASVDRLWRRLEGLSAGDMATAVPKIAGDATLVEVAAMMLLHRRRIVGVVDGDRTIGGITIDDLLTHLRPV
jgi:CBS domain-containing protein